MLIMNCITQLAISQVLCHPGCYLKCTPRCCLIQTGSLHFCENGPFEPEALLTGPTPVYCNPYYRGSFKNALFLENRPGQAESSRIGGKQGCRLLTKRSSHFNYLNPRDPSIQTTPTLGPKVCKYDLHWATWIPT